MNKPKQNLRTTSIRFSTYPRTEPAPEFVRRIIDVFVAHEKAISTELLAKGLTSNEVLNELSGDLRDLEFVVEQGKRREQKIERPVFFGENGRATLNYQIDAYHEKWRCALEIEAGRAWMGNAVYRDLVQALVMVGVDQLCLAVPMRYKFKSSGRRISSPDYENTRALADAVYGHSRIRMPYNLVVIGY